jgi:hypothetical protein
MAALVSKSANASPGPSLRQPEPSSRRRDQDRADARRPPVLGKEIDQGVCLVELSCFNRDIGRHPGRESESRREVAVLEDP